MVVVVVSLSSGLDKYDNGVLTQPAFIYPLKVNNRNARTRCEICSKLTVKIPEQRHWCRYGIFIVNSEHVIAGWVS